MLARLLELSNPSERAATQSQEAKARHTPARYARPAAGLLCIRNKAKKGSIFI